MTHLVFAAAVDDLSPGSLRLLPPEDTGLAVPVTLVRDLDGEFHAIGDSCPHVGASLARGVVHGDAVIECPLHHGLWCLRTGEAVRYPARTPAEIYRLEVREGAVWLRPSDAG